VQAVVCVLPLHLTGETLARAIGSIGDDLGTARTIIFDALGMKDYTPEARNTFIDIVRDLAPGTRVAVVTDRPMWRIVISAMALAAAREIRVFTARRAAEAYAKTA
jgi:hypothetical protein